MAALAAAVGVLVEAVVVSILKVIVLGLGGATWILPRIGELKGIPSASTSTSSLANYPL